MIGPFAKGRETIAKYLGQKVTVTSGNDFGDLLLADEITMQKPPKPALEM